MVNRGLMIGKFAPLTNGHLTAFSMALLKCESLDVVVCIDHLHDPVDCPLSPVDRFEVVKRECAALSGRIHVSMIDCTSFPYAKEDDDEVSKYWAQVLHKDFPETKTLFGSELYVEMMAKHWPDCLGVQCEILDINRDMTKISATLVRKDPFTYWEHIPVSVRPFFTKNVLILGAESCGKTTLANTLAGLLKAPMVPEMYRSIYVNKGMDFTAQDLVPVAHAQCMAGWEAGKYPFNKGVVIHDTCCEITQMYLNEYYPNCSKEIQESIQDKIDHEVKFNLILFCDTDVSWVNDGTRTLGNAEDRKRMRDKAFSVAVQKAKRHGCELVMLPADYKRVPMALEQIRKVMK